MGIGWQQRGEGLLPEIKHGLLFSIDQYFKRQLWIKHLENRISFYLILPTKK